MATLTINFTPASPIPTAGYRVIYWPTGNPGAAVTVTPNPTSSPVVITGLAGTDYTGTIEADCGGGQYSSPQNFNASVTYYYYTGILCGGSIVKSFRSTVSLSGSEIVKAWCDICGGGSYQCFDTISPTMTPNTNDVIEIYTTCQSCTDNCISYEVSPSTGSVTVEYEDCATGSITTQTITTTTTFCARYGTLSTYYGTATVTAQGGC